MTHTLALPRTDFDLQVEEEREDETVDYSGWFCLSSDPWPCPASGCDFVAEHLTVAHLILVWPRQDDRALLNAAFDAQRVGRNPRVVEYEVALGPCVPYDVWVRIGKPIHGAREKPAGWGERARL